MAAIAIANGNCYRFGFGPSDFETGANSLHSTAKPFRPFRNSERFALVSNQPIGSAIPSLLNTSGPSDIPWGIMAVRVDPIQRVRWGRGGSYVGQKCGERLLPPRADCNSTAAIVVIAPARLASTTVLHRNPRSIFVRITPSRSVPMRTGSIAGNSGFVASAANGTTRGKITASNCFCDSTFTDAIPTRIAVSATVVVASKSDDTEPSKYSPRKVCRVTTYRISHKWRSHQIPHEVVQAKMPQCHSQSNLSYFDK